MASSFSSPWPDPNSPVLSKIDFGLPLVELLKWLDVRDTLLGENYKKQDITAALALARYCKHPDAVWLTSIFEEKGVSTKEDVREIFLSDQNDARSLCFAWCLSAPVVRKSDLTLLCRAAEMGNAFACSLLCFEMMFTNIERGFSLAQFAVSQCEREGFRWLGNFFRDGIGCEANLGLAKENYLLAAELGSVYAAKLFGDLLDVFDLARWVWHGRAALHGYSAPFVGCFSNQVDLFFSGCGNATVVFLIGLALKGNIDMEKKEIFGPLHFFNFDSLIGRANQALSFYEHQTKCAHLAVDTWALVSTRLCLIKDLRIYIGKMIWEARFEANYK